MFFPAGQFAQCRSKGFDAEIIFAAGAVDAVQEGGNIDEFVPGIQKIKVQDLLSCHIETLVPKLKIVNG